MIIRDLTTLDDCLRVAALEKDVWGYADGEDVVPAAVLIVSIKRGGILLGAFDGRAAHGVCLLDAGAQGRPADAVVAHARRDARRARLGLGLRLKLAQRERALAMGLDVIEWTFDPLQALNAHLNMARLGAVVEEYEENIYGDSSSPLHRGSPTDRLVASGSCRRRTSSGASMAPDRSWREMRRSWRRPDRRGGRAPAARWSRGDPVLTLDDRRVADRRARRIHRHARARSRSRAPLAHGNADRIPDLLRAQLSGCRLPTGGDRRQGQYLLQKAVKG